MILQPSHAISVRHCNFFKCPPRQCSPCILRPLGKQSAMISLQIGRLLHCPFSALRKTTASPRPRTIYIYRVTSLFSAQFGSCQQLFLGYRFPHPSLLLFFPSLSEVIDRVILTCQGSKPKPSGTACGSPAGCKGKAVPIESLLLHPVPLSH